MINNFLEILIDILYGCGNGFKNRVRVSVYFHVRHFVFCCHGVGIFLIYGLILIFG